LVNAPTCGGCKTNWLVYTNNFKLQIPPESSACHRPLPKTFLELPALIRRLRASIGAMGIMPALLRSTSTRPKMLRSTCECKFPCKVYSSHHASGNPLKIRVVLIHEFEKQRGTNGL